VVVKGCTLIIIRGWTPWLPTLYIIVIRDPPDDENVLSEGGQAGLKAWSLRCVAILKEAIESWRIKPNFK
jgi:hypothetical protein